MLQRVSFSTVKMEDLKRAGVTRGRLHFKPAKVDQLTQKLANRADAEIIDLHSRIKRIYATVNLNVGHIAPPCDCSTDKTPIV